MSDETPRRALPPEHSATLPSPTHQPSPRRVKAATATAHDAPSSSRRPSPARHRRSGSLRRSLLLTLASTVLPGSGLLGAKNRAAKLTGTFAVSVYLLMLLGGAWLILGRLGDIAAAIVDPARLGLLTGAAVVGAGIWVALITGTHLVTRPRNLAPLKKAIGALCVASLSFLVAAPLAVASRYSHDQRVLVETVFAEDDDVQASSRPSLAEGDDPWADTPRLNILLLGGDSASSRDPANGVRTDTIMVASIDTATGETTLVQIPRNVQYTPFPRGSEMADAFPYGFRGEGDPAQWFINGLWPRVEGDYPALMQGNTYRGAEALKQGVEGITGLPIDYFVLLNIDGIQELIDAMGGVSVNINERLPIGGDSQGRQPSGYLEPGPNQQLDGFHAMWYARSRLGSSDYARMARQSCLVNAIIDQASPSTMLTSYEALARAGAGMVLTDIPRDVLDPLVQLALRVKDAEIERLVFAPGKNGYDFADPDFDAMRLAVREALQKPQVGPTPTGSPTSEPVASAPSSIESATMSPAEQPSSSTSATLVEGSQDVQDACAYHPDTNQTDETEG